MSETLEQPQSQPHPQRHTTTAAQTNADSLAQLLCDDAEIRNIMLQAAPSASKTVYVSGLAASATEKKLLDFFTFCGKIEAVQMVSVEDGQVAYINFATEEAAQTALLLTNAHIIDRPITVQLLVDVYHVDPTKGTVIQGADIKQKEFGTPDSQRTKTSVIASLIAAGYSLGDDALTRARQIDEKHSISQQIKFGAGIIKDQVQSRVSTIDKALGISEKAAIVRDGAILGVQKIDENLKISEKASTVAQAFEDLATNIKSRAMQNETFASGVNKIQETFTNVGNTIKTKIEEEKKEIDRAIEEKQQEKAAAIPAAQVTPQPPTMDASGELASAPKEGGLYPTLRPEYDEESGTKN